MSFKVFGFEIYYYGIIIAAGMLLAFIVCLFLFKSKKYKDETAYLLLLLCVPCGIIFARLYYVAFSDWSQYHSFFDVFNIRSGGIAIYGGVIGGALGLFAVARIKRCGFFTLADIVVVCLILAQSIGRWGNFTNSEAYGLPVDNHIFPFTVNINGHAHLATFFYESVLNLVGFFVLFTILRKQKKWGTTSAFYLIWYGFVRAVIEPLRTDSLLVFGSNTMIFNRVSFILSLVIIMLGVILLFTIRRGWISQENSSLLKNESEDCKCSNKKSTDIKKAK